MRRPRMTRKVREGLRWLAEYGRGWLEADDWETPRGIDEAEGTDQVGEIEAALTFIGAGGLSK